jgi:uncharacterized membrane protein
MRHTVTTSPIVAAGSVPESSRIRSIDVVRGAVMVLMALDHVRDWVTNLRFQPEDLSRASAALFATRWVTHFCAPTFFLLAGLGIGILRTKLPAAAMTRYLVTRGVWLLFLELVLTPIGWQFGFRLIPAFALVLWALGWSMIVMALLIHLPRGVLATLALATIAGHNLLDPITPASLGAWSGIWNVLHVPGFAVPGVLFVAYPLLPWVGVMALGYVLAPIYAWDAGRRRRLLLAAGVAAAIAFLVLRALNGYGNPRPWAPQRTSALTVASFLNLLKYPPSLQFLLMTLGPALIALALVDRARGPAARWLSVYGRVPLFFYVAHIFVAHAAAVALALIQGGELRRIQIVTDPASIPAWYGLPLPGVYLVWALVVLSLYLPCRRLGRLKDAQAARWLRFV